MLQQEKSFSHRGRAVTTKEQDVVRGNVKEKLKLRKMFRERVSQSDPAFFLSSEERDRFTSSVLLSIVCLLRNEGVLSFRLCACLFCVLFRRSKGGRAPPFE